MSDTLAEQLLGAPAGAHVVRDVDLVFSHDATTPLAIKALDELFAGTGRTPRLAHPERAAVVFDHAYPAPNVVFAEHQRQVRAFVRGQGIGHFYPGEGICHLVLPEKGLVRPGSLVVGADSHTCTLGALGAFATGVGSTDVAVAWATGRTWLLVPETLRIDVHGCFQDGAGAKDLALWLAREIGQDGATYQAIEWGGPGWANVPMHARFTLANMAVDVGAKTALCETDARTDAWLQHHGVETRAPLRPAPDAAYAARMDVDLATIEPLVSGPHTLDAIAPASSLAGTPLDRVVIGSCTNARVEDLAEAAAVLAGHRVRVETFVVPGSVRIAREAEETGILRTLQRAGCTVLAPGCGPCLGRHQGVLAAGERCLTTHNRNVPGRMGSPEAEIYLASPTVAAWSALSGEISGPGEVALVGGGVR